MNQEYIAVIKKSWTTEDIANHNLQDPKAEEERMTILTHKNKTWLVRYYNQIKDLVEIPVTAKP